jgi:hypothetical protein
MNTTETFSEVTNFCGRPCIKHSYPSRPSWKAYGQGRASIEIHVDTDGSLCVISQEIPEGLRGLKETHVSLPRKLAVALAKAINQWQPEQQ